MSKKILKRSLALGALMAFVITGNAYAEAVLGEGKYILDDGKYVAHGIQNHEGYFGYGGSESENVWTLGDNILIVDAKSNDPCGWSDYAVVADRYSFIGNDNSALMINSKGDTKLINGLAIAGSVDVGTLGIDVQQYGVRSFAGSTNLTANNFDINAGYIALNAAEGGNIKVKVKEKLNISGGSAAIFAQDTNALVEVVSYDEDKADIMIDGDIYANGTVNIKLESKASYLDGAIYTAESGNANLTLNSGATWNVTDDSTVSGIVANGDAVIDGTKADGSAEDNKYSLSLNRKLNIYNKYLINHTSGTLKINNLIIDGIEKVTTSGNSNGSVINGSGNADLLVITNSVISNNKNVCSEGLNWSSSLKPYAVIDVSSNMNIENTTFENNETDYMGGALYLHKKEFNITGSVFENNSADQGAAIQTNTATVNLKGKNTFKGNTSKKASNDSGGAITTQGGTMNFLGETTFEENQALNGNGGAINSYYDNSTMNFVEKSNSFFRDNYAKLVGGAIHNNSTSILNFNGTAEFTNNEAGNEGGAIYNDSIVNFNYGSTTVFSGNTANGIANDIYNAGIININQGAKVTLDGGITGSGTTNINGGNLVLKGGTTYVETLGGDDGIIRFESADAKLEVKTNNNDALKFTATSEVNAAVDGDANKLISNVDWAKDTTMVMEAGYIVGEVTAELGENKDTGKLIVKSKTEAPNPANQSISDAGISLKLHWRSHMNDMNKRMGELRNANGEHGVWTRMVRGESEYENAKAQYNQYQLGYDEKLSVDKRWTVGAAVTFAEGDANYGYGSTDDKSTAFAVYGTKLNDDGTFVDLIARYAHLESDYEDVTSGKGDYSTNGMSVSAEFGKRIQQGNGLWVEPQVELTYGTIDSAEFQLDNKTVHVGDVDSLIGRIGFRIGKDIEKGNVYARASYLYDFDGETVNAFSNGNQTRYFKEDLGGGWWEVGVGANINLSKATYVYSDVEKTFGGEVDTNWQWNLGVRYSF